MQYELLKFLRCPVTGQSLQLQTIEEYNRTYSGGSVTEIKTGILQSDSDWIYPVINGIPRMLPESMIEHIGFLREYMEDIDQRLQKLESDFNQLATNNLKKNARTKASFALEWKFLHPEKKDKLWHFDQTSLRSVFLQESGLQISDLKDKLILDAGCGHGIMTSVIAGIGSVAIGMELSLAIENAYERNQEQKAWYVQGDVQFSPFEPERFDVIYCSGVLHHTNNTKRSLSLLVSFLKKQGILSLWLYHPRDNKLHNLSMRGRKIISKLPINLAALGLIVFVMPVTLVIKKIKGHRHLHYREEIIDLLDAFTPEFRDEIPQAQTISWLQQFGFGDCMITSSNTFGYSVSAEKHA